MITGHGEFCEITLEWVRERGGVSNDKRSSSPLISTTTASIIRKHTDASYNHEPTRGGTRKKTAFGFTKDEKLEGFTTKPAGDTLADAGMRKGAQGEFLYRRPEKAEEARAGYATSFVVFQREGTAHTPFPYKK